MSKSSSPSTYEKQFVWKQKIKIRNERARKKKIRQEQQFSFSPKINKTTSTAIVSKENIDYNDFTVPCELYNIPSALNHLIRYKEARRIRDEKLRFFFFYLYLVQIFLIF